MAFGSPQWMYKSGEAYTIDQSLKFNDDDSASLSWTPSSAGNRLRWTWSAWVKRSALSSNDTLFSAKANTASIWVTSGDMIRVEQYDGSGGYDFRKDFSGVLRDTSAWYHLVIVYDSAQGSEPDRIKAYLNGTQLAVDYTYNAMSSSFQSEFNNTETHWLGTLGSQYWDGYLAEVNFVDGQALTPADFGETGDYGEWKPIEYSGTYGTNGFYLPFKQDYTVEGFSTVTYKGTGQNGQYVGGAGFKPDLVWQKDRSSAYNHAIQDVIRGAGTDTHLASNTTSAEGEFPTYHNFQSFDNDGFTIGKTSNATNMQSHTGDNYVAWNWDMGADTPTGFSAVTYKGNGGTQSISGFGFSPDLVWVKNRSNLEEHALTDTVRGANKILESDTSDAENTYTDGLTKFDPDGFSIGASSRFSANNDNYVAWGWDMGNTTATNTSGSITSTVMANPTYGQSIVSWTGTGANATIGHGLSSAPDLVMYKNRDDAGTSGATNGNWIVQSSAIGANDFLLLNDNSPEATDSGYFNGTRPSSSVLTVGAYNSNNGSSDKMIAYCFHSVSGYSKISSYTGNGSSTGPSVTLGFRPAFVMIKVADRTDGGNGAWWMFDSTRSFGTAIGNVSLANTNGVELVDNSNLAIDFNSNGFQLKSSYDEINVNGGTYVYMAFAGGVDSVSDFNTTGTIESRVKANTTYGQSIVSYTGNGSDGATVGHGLSSAPDMVIVKSRDSVHSWSVGHVGLGTNEVLLLNQTSAKANCTTGFSGGGVGARGATTFTLEAGTSNANNVNTNNEGFIAYCFHSVTGYSKFGSYTGNASATGPSVTTGFEPAFLVVKKATGVADWHMFDNLRGTSIDNKEYLKPNSSAAEATSAVEATIFDFTSTGFQAKGSSGDINGSGETYIYMAFADTREYAYWLDQSGNNNDWTSNNLTESDISVDSPSNNFATMNPLDKDSDITLYEGNTRAYSTNSGGYACTSTISTDSGKWYAEINSLVLPASTRVFGGWALNNYDDSYSALNDFIIHNLGSYQRYVALGSNYDNVSTSFAAGDILQLAWDMDAGKFWFGKNGTWINSGNPSSGTNATVTSSSVDSVRVVYRVSAGAGTTGNLVFNFGQDSSFAGNKTSQGYQDGNDIGDFFYEPPTGFLALCTKNLPDVAVTPSEHFNTVLYSGNGTSQSIATDLDPDWVWVKGRSHATSHITVDAVRGDKQLVTNSTSAEADLSSHFNLTTTGFNLLSSTTGLNASGRTYVAWNWKANGSGSSNTNGTITSTVSANVDAGFSIISYTGNGSNNQTLGHGLSKAPEIGIFKERGGSASWQVETSNITGTIGDLLYLNATTALDSATTDFSAKPTSSVFQIGGGNVNENNMAMICYAFHSVDGYSKVGSYTGNGSTDGPFVYTGFKPAYIIAKKTDAAENWVVIDNARHPYNDVNTPRLLPNTSAAEAEDGSIYVDYLSNGFKIKATQNMMNNPSSNYIFLAFAETPFKYSNAR